MSRHLRVFATIATIVCTVALSGCGGDTTDTDTAAVPPIDTVSAPAQLGWDSYRGVRLPRSPLSGPTHYSGSVATGYSKDPQGAVLAAIRGQAYLALTPDELWGEMVATVTAPGAGRNEFAANRALVSVTGDVPPERAARFVAFKVTEYRPDASPPTAAVEVVQQIGSPPQAFVYPVALAWIGNWRLVLPTAAENIDARPIEHLDGYTMLEDTQ